MIALNVNIQITNATKYDTIGLRTTTTKAEPLNV